MSPWRQATWSRCVRLKDTRRPSLRLKDTPPQSPRIATTAPPTLPPPLVPGLSRGRVLELFLFLSFSPLKHRNAVPVFWCQTHQYVQVWPVFLFFCMLLIVLMVDLWWTLSHLEKTNRCFKVWACFNADLLSVNPCGVWHVFYFN